MRILGHAGAVLGWFRSLSENFCTVSTGVTYLHKRFQQVGLSRRFS